MKNKKYKTSPLRDLAIIAAVALSLFASSRAIGGTPYAKRSKSVVKVTNMLGTSGGTGFLIHDTRDRPVLITNWHVCGVADPEGRVLATRDGEYEVLAYVRKTDPQHDLCALTAVPGEALDVGSDAVSLQRVYVLGHPMLRPQTPSTGLVVSTHVDPLLFEFGTGCVEGMQPVSNLFGVGCLGMIEMTDTTAPIAPGNSGSPVTDESGAVVGVINSGYGPQFYGAMIPVKHLKKFLESL